MATIPVGTYPTWVTVNQATNQTYVANYGGNSLSVIDGITNQVVQTVTVGAGPRSLAFNPTTNRLYVTNAGTGLQVLDVANTFAPIATLSTVGAWHVEVNPTTNIVYVTAPDQNRVTVINGQTTTVITTVATPPGPTDVAIDTTTNDYYVSDGKVNAVSHFNGTTTT